MADTGDDEIPELPDDDEDHKAWTDSPLHRDVEHMDADDVDADDREVTEEADDGQ